MVEMSVEGATLAPMNRLRSVPLALVATVVMCTLVGCIPRQRGESTEVRRDSDTRGEVAPVLPANPPKGLVVEAIRFDLTYRPDDQDFWTPTRSESKCVAEKIVTGVGYQRLSELGYQPGTPGAGLPDLAFTPEEDQLVLAAFQECVDYREAAAAILFGKGRISNSSAKCLAKVLYEAGVIGEIFESWLSKTPIDPFANDGLFASRLSAGAQVCLTPNDLNWPTLKSPSDDQDLIDADAPAGSSDSNHPDDRRPREEGN